MVRSEFGEKTQKHGSCFVLKVQAAFYADHFHLYDHRDMVEQEFVIMGVQLTNVQQLWDAAMSIRTKVSEECFQNLAETTARRRKAI